MDDIVVVVEKIESWFINADYRQCYEAFLKLCNPHSEFQDSAQMIVARFSDLEKDIEKGIVSLSEQHLRKNEIASSYQACMKRFKECRLSNCTNCCIYDEDEYSLIQQKEQIRQTRIRVEDELDMSDDPKKRSLLEKILIEIRNFLKQINTLLKHFSEVRNYEQI